MKKISWIVSFCALALGFSAEARTVAISQQTADSLTFVFGGQDTYDYELMVASGTTDGGDSKAKWDRFDKVADVAYNATSYTYAVPAELRDGRYLRFFLMQRVTLNYAQDLDCVRSTGAQYINTGVTPNSSTIVDFRFGDVTYVHQTAFFGQEWTSSRYLLNQQSNKFMFHGAGTLGFTLAPAANTDYRCVVRNNNQLTLSVTPKGGTTTDYRSSISRATSSGAFAIFGSNDNKHNATFRFDSMYLGNNITLQRHFTPALDANGVAGLYDHVNNAFYKSATSTALVAGTPLTNGSYGRIMDQTPTLRFRRTFAVTTRTSDAVTFAFSNPDGAAHTLCVASGTTDGGPVKSKWTNFEAIATIAADATAYTYTLPAALKTAGTYYRFFLLKTTDLPYTSELASITSTGAQNVPTDYIPGPDTTARLAFGNVTYVHQTTFFGQHWNSSCYLLNQQSNAFYFHSSGNLLDASVLANTDYVCEVNDDNSIVLSHGTVSHGYTGISRATQPFTPIHVFSCPNGERMATFRFDGLQLWDKGLAVADLAPVLLSSGKGALYDHVSGKCYSNITSTDFTKGTALDASRTGQILAESATFATPVVDNVVIAEWCGAGDRANIADPANWICRDGAGTVIANGVPSATTIVQLTALTDFNCPAGQTLTCAKIESPSALKLSKDCDWTGITNADLLPNVNLNGHKLTVNPSYVPRIQGAGTLDFSVASGATVNNGSWNYCSNVAFVKRGAGTFTITKSLTGMASLTVKEGWAKMGMISAFTKGASVVVENGACFDMCGQRDNYIVVTMEGTGPDGLGALRNSSGSFSSGTGQLAGIRLTGDATFYAPTGHFGLLNGSYSTTVCELNGHTLTVNEKTGCGFWLANCSGNSSGTIYVKNGVLYPYHGSYTVNLPNVDLVFDGSNSIFRMPTSNYAKSATFRDVTLKNGASYEEGMNNVFLRNFTVTDNCTVPNTAVRWIYVSGTVLVSNETSDITIYPPICENGTYPKLIKQGAGTLTIANNHSENHMNGGVDVQGGTVVMSSTHSSKNYHYAIAKDPCPVTIRKGATLDMTACTASQAFQITTLTIEEGGTLKHNANSVIQFPNATTFSTLPINFQGTIKFPNVVNVTFDVSKLYAGDNPPAQGSTTTLMTGATAITGRPVLLLSGAPSTAFLNVTDTTISLVSRSAEQLALTPLKLSCLGDGFVYGRLNASGTGVGFRTGVGMTLEAEGWNIQWTGWRTSTDNLPSGYNMTYAPWSGCGSVTDLALKTSATRAGLLEGLESYCAAASEPDFMLLCCGAIDLADGVADDTIFANYTNAVSRIRSALPMTTVLASTIPDASTTLNDRIKTWAATQTEVEAIDLATCLTTNTATKSVEQQYKEMIASVVSSIKSLATADGKKTPTVWTRPAVKLGVTNNVPAAYWQGFQQMAVLDVPASVSYNQTKNSACYSVTPTLPRTGIAKAGYYVELVHGTTGTLQALWVDMDAPDSTWDAISLPVTLAQQRQQAVTNLHVWSNTRAVTCVPPTDNTVTGFIEFNCINYSAASKSTETGWIADPSETAFGFNDTFATSGSSGHGCFQLMRKFADSSVYPHGEVLFSLVRWGAASAAEPGIGIGTLANYGKHGWTDSIELDRTFCYDAKAQGLRATTWSLRRIEFWVKYGDTPGNRASCVDAVWANNVDTTIWQYTNWVTSAGKAVTSYDYCTWLIPEGTDVSFSYLGYDNITHWATTFIIDGKVTLPTVGGFYNNQVTVGPTGVLTFDPTEFSWRLRTFPTFEQGGKFALPEKYRNNTRGKFLLFTIQPNSGELLNSQATDADYADAFDLTSAPNAINPKITIERLANGTTAYVWLDLAYGEARETMNVLCVGDSITHGSDSTYGNWRTMLAKKIEAAGYNANMKGFRTDNSHDINMCELPAAWTRHAGISGQRLITKNGGGTIDALENTLDQAGDIDFMLVKLGTNDINSNGSTGDQLYPVWTNFVFKCLTAKPHLKFVAGAVVDIAYNATKNTQVTNFNYQVKTAITGGTIFPAGRTFFSDLYTPCYRYDADGNYITGSFYSSNNLHPDWPGEAKMAETYFATITNAVAHADSDWQLNTHTAITATTTGCENNVPAAELAGFKRARVLDLVANRDQNLFTLGYVPYTTEGCDATAATQNLTRVGYYVELTRKDTMGSTYDGLTRWMWISADAFGSRSLADVGVPLTTVYQSRVSNGRVKTNMPGIADTADGATETLWAEFWPSSYSNGAGGASGAPGNTWGYDWNDTRTDNMSGYGSMQFHRFLPTGSANPAQVLFAFNSWTCDEAWCFGLGNFANQSTSSIDWTFVAKTFPDAFDANAYTVAKIEIWTAAPDEGSITLDDVYTSDGVTTVTGTVLDLGAGATNATLTLEWSTDPDFATVTGSTNLGTITQTGTVTGAITNLATGTAWYVRFRTVNSEGSTATGAKQYTANYGLWRPQATSVNWSDIAWLANGVGSPVAFGSGWMAQFDGAETTKATAVAVTNAVTAESILVKGTSAYTFNGAGGVSARKLVKQGSGTLVLDTKVLGTTPDIDIEEGVVKLGDSAVRGAVGSASGTITVKDGAQFDFNYNDSSSGNNRTRALTTSHKTFVIAGAGPDGKGALTTTKSNNGWGSPINKIILSGDATIGGVARIDVRGNSNNSITGPTNVTLTIKNTAGSGARGLNVHGPTSVGKLVIAEGAAWTPEGSAASFVVPNGIELAGTMAMYGSSASWNVGGLKSVGTKGVIMAEYGTSAVKTCLTVPSGTALTLNGGATIDYSGAVTNAGTLTVSAGTHNLNGAVRNSGTFTAAGGTVNIYGPLAAEATSQQKVTGAAVNIYGNVTYADGATITQSSGNYYHRSNGTSVSGDLTLDISGGMFWLGGNNDCSKLDITANMSGSSHFVLGFNGDGYGLPNIPAEQLHINALSGNTGVVYFHSSTDDRYDNLKINGTIGHFRPQGPNGNAVSRTDATNLQVTANEVWVGTASGKANLHVGGATSVLNANKLCVSQSSGYRGTLTWHDGLLGIGSGGIWTEWRQQQREQLVLVGGTLKANANFSFWSAGMNASFGTPVAGNAVTVDLNGKTVEWSTGLNGADDVTITGAGSFAPDRPGIQGIPTGHWTINSTGTVNLQNAAGFPKGLTLADNANVSLDIAGTNTVEMRVWTWDGNAWNTMRDVYSSTAAAQFVASSLTYLNRSPTAIKDNKYGSGTGINYIGQFYVSAERAGTWYFAIQGFKHAGIRVDTTDVLQLGPKEGAIKTINLTEGWHDFMVSYYTGEANPTIGTNTSCNDAQKQNLVWFKVGGSGNGSWPSDYQTFDMPNVPMRKRPVTTAYTSVRRRQIKYYGESQNKYNSLGEHEYTDMDQIDTTLQTFHTKYSTGVNAPLGGACSRFDGYFYVTAAMAGNWSFQGNFDDRISIRVDGRLVMSSPSNCGTGTGTMTLREGWHAFDIRTADNTPSGVTNYGTGGALTDKHGNGCALMFNANNLGWQAFDERYLRIASTVGDAQKWERSGLDGTVTVGAGATLANAARTAYGAFCPIYGTLAGTGTLTGPFRFLGANTCWQVAVKTRTYQAEAVTFTSAHDSTLADLKALEVTFDDTPIRRSYLVSPALGLTAENLSQVAFTAVDAKGNDVSEHLSLTIADGNLKIMNAHPRGIVVILR